MSKPIVGFAEISGWKQHGCVVCGRWFQYRMARASAGSGITLEWAEHFARQRCLVALARDFERVPCPHCGRYQPATFVPHRFRKHAIAAVGMLVVISLAIAVLANSGMFNYIVAGVEIAFQIPSMVLCSWLLLGIALSSTAWHLHVARDNPNRYPEKNLELTGTSPRVQVFALQDSVPSPEPLLPPNYAGITRLVKTGLICLALASILAIAPELVRIVNNWPANQGWYPAVVGPGDEATAYFPDPIKSFEGRWDGTSVVRVVNAGELELPSAEFRSRTMEGKGGSPASGKDKHNCRTSVWVCLEVPGDAKLSRRHLQLEMAAIVSFPVEESKRRFRTMHTERAMGRDLELATFRAGNTYNLLWWGSLASVCGLYVVGAAIILVSENQLQYRGYRSPFVPDPVPV